MIEGSRISILSGRPITKDYQTLRCLVKSVDLTPISAFQNQSWSEINFLMDDTKSHFLSLTSGSYDLTGR